MSGPRLGIFPMDAAAYHADKSAVSKSMLATFAQRRRVYFAETYEGREPDGGDAATDKGTLTHIGLLEPDRFADAYAIFPADLLSKNGAISTTAAKDFKADQEAAGRIVLKQADFEAVLAMIASVQQKLDAWLNVESIREHAVYWHHEETGLLCRCRPDWLIKKRKKAYIIDLKTTGNAAPFEFQKRSEQFAYWLQHVHYSEGVHAAYGRKVDTEFLFTVVESEFPFTTAIYRLKPSVVAIGEQRRAELLRDLAECVQTGDFSEPWEKEIQPLDIRGFAFGGSTSHV